MLEARRPKLQPSDLRFERFRAVALLALNQAAYAAALWLDLPVACRLATLIGLASRMVRRFAPARRLENAFRRMVDTFASLAGATAGIFVRRDRRGRNRVRVLASSPTAVNGASRGTGMARVPIAGPIRMSRRGHPERVEGPPVASLRFRPALAG